MSVPAGERSVPPAHEPLTESSLKIHRPGEPLLSPSIRVAGDKSVAYEVKFVASPELAAQIERWAADRMAPDAFSDPQQGGGYQTTTLYLDTAERDVLLRSAGFRRRKFRLRRYGLESRVYLERKTRHGDRVSKRRSNAQLDALLRGTPFFGAPLADVSPHGGLAPPGEADWFWKRVAASGLRPACRITYDRTAFVAQGDEGSLRLTLDRRIRGTLTEQWDLTPLVDDRAALTEQVVCELKFRNALPNLFKQLIGELRLDAGSFSKYRRIMLAEGAGNGTARTNDVAPRTFAGEERKHA